MIHYNGVVAAQLYNKNSIESYEMFINDYMTHINNDITIQHKRFCGESEHFKALLYDISIYVQVIFNR